MEFTILVLKRNRGERLYLYVKDPVSGIEHRVVIEVASKPHDTVMKVGVIAESNVRVVREELVDTDKRIPPTRYTGG